MLEIEKSYGDCSGANIKCVEIKQNGCTFSLGSKQELVRTDSVASYVECFSLFMH